MGYSNFVILKRENGDFILSALRKKKSVIIRVHSVDDEDDINIVSRSFELAKSFAKLDIGPKIIEELSFHLRSPGEESSASRLRRK